MRRRVIGWGLGIVASCVLTVSLEAAGVAAAPRSSAPPKPAPAIEVTTLDGRTISLEALKGKVVLVDFWATWCPPCREEIPHFIQLYNTYAPKIEILGVAMDEEGEEVVAPFVKEHQIPYPIAIGTEALMDAFGGVRGLPTTFVVDPKGRIIRKYLGYQELEVFEQDIRALLPDS